MGGIPRFRFAFTLRLRGGGSGSPEHTAKRLMRPLIWQQWAAERIMTKETALQSQN